MLSGIRSACTTAETRAKSPNDCHNVLRETKEEMNNIPTRHDPSPFFPQICCSIMTLYFML